jgi:hypothetical protein
MFAAMGTWSRSEIETAFEHYQSEVRRACATGDWNIFAELFTEDATYHEHGFGDFVGREAIRVWITDTMASFPGNAMPAFPIKWRVIDEERGWVICDILNRMADPGDGSVYEASNITVLHYAGDNHFSHEEDAYNPMAFLRMVRKWCGRAKEFGNLPPDGATWLQMVSG